MFLSENHDVCEDVPPVLDRGNTIIAPHDSVQCLKLFKEQAAMINTLFELHRSLEKKIEELQTKIQGSPVTAQFSSTPSTESTMIPVAETSESQPQKKQRRSAMSKLTDVWYEWFVREPRIWELGVKCVSRQRLSDLRQIVSYMKIFLPEGMDLQPDSESYKSDVLTTGSTASENLQNFCKLKGVKAVGSCSLLKHLRRLHTEGELNILIEGFNTRKQAGLVCDPTPLKATFELKLF